MSQKRERKITIKNRLPRSLCFLLLIGFGFAARAANSFSILSPSAFAPHIERFNTLDNEGQPTFISNKKSRAWLPDNIPLFECPDAEVEEIYYFRWWSFRKHITRSPKGYVITEFLTPVSHAGEFNTISCAAGFHLAEGRWLRDPIYLDAYIRFWLRGDNGKPQPHFHKFSSWFAAAAWDRYLVNGDKKFITGILNDLVGDYRAWESERQLANGLFWQYDVRDGMEESISGSRTNQNIRPTINSYMFGNAQAIANISKLAGKPKLVAEFDAKATDLKHLTLESLWDSDAQFFKVRLGVAAGVSPAVEPGVPPGGKLHNISKRTGNSHAGSGGRMPPSTSGGTPDTTSFSDAREAIGFIPWMFGLPDASHGYEAAWLQFADPHGFKAPFGITTAERRHPEFRSHGVGTCEWDGAIWPFATSQKLSALANVLRNCQASVAADVSRREFLQDVQRGLTSAATVTPRDYFDAFLTYVHSQHADGKPYIGEYLDEVTGDWINGRNDRSRYYNHSSFADLLITGVVGLRPRADNVVEVSPLLPEGVWDWFCLDGVKYHGRTLTILWDKDGSRYGRGNGLMILANGKEILKSNKLARVTGSLP